ncbi:MAG: class I SAM-dependent methyltransferase [Actinomycetota bacterium]|nr:class I SAM-dependent methyltransferase [Actinomycetota bacterium]
MTATIANVEMAEAWNVEGEDWARDWERYDSGIRGYHERLLAAAAVAPGERVLDVGCGNGQVARDLAKSGAHAIGIDLSRPMLHRARELAADLPGAEFVEGDAQVHAFPDSSFDVIVSRFGAMFFADRRAAFANLARSTRPGGRLALLAWQELAKNEWLQEIRGALALGRDLPSPPAGGPGPFGLADAEAVCADLAQAGYAEVQVAPVLEAFVPGRDAEHAYAFLGNVGVVRGLLDGLPEVDVARGRAQLKETLVRHETGDGVVLGSASWLFTGTREA